MKDVMKVDVSPQNLNKKELKKKQKTPFVPKVQTIIITDQSI